MITRRSLLISAAAAMPVGIGSALVTRAFSDRSARVRFIGQRDSLISLLDTGAERVLIVVGNPSDRLLDNVPSLLTAGRSRVDLLIATHHVLTETGLINSQLGQRARIISVQGSSSLPPLRGVASTAVDQQKIQLGNVANLDLKVAPVASDIDSDLAAPAFSTEFTYGNVRIAIVTDTSPALLISGHRPDLLAIPGTAEADAVTRWQPTLLATSSPDSTLDVSQIQIFVNDPLTCSITGEGIRIREDQLFS